MLQAMECLQNLKTTMTSPFTCPFPYELAAPNAAFVGFERFGTTLDKLILQGVEELTSEDQNVHTTKILAVLVTQSIHLASLGSIDAFETDSANKTKLLATDQKYEIENIAALFIVTGRQWRMHWPSLYEPLGPCVGRLDSGLASLDALIDLGAKIHVEATRVLKTLSLWESLPETTRQHASFMSGEVQFPDGFDYLPDQILGLDDCLGRTTFLQFLDRFENEKTNVDVLGDILEICNDCAEDVFQHFDSQDILGRTALHESS